MSSNVNYGFSLKTATLSQSVRGKRALIEDEDRFLTGRIDGLGIVL